MSGNDTKYFSKGKVQELREELAAADRRDTKHTKKRIVLKKIVANMTMGNDMSPLFADVVAVMQAPMLEVKKMAYLYIVSYARAKPDLAKLTIAAFERDLVDPNPLIRALALRTMGYMQVDKLIDALSTALVKSLADRDAYVAKTAAIAVVKLYTHDRFAIDRASLMDKLRNLLNSDNSMVVANAVAALTEIAERNPGFDMRVDFPLASRLLTALNECSEWGQVYILEALLYFVPQEHSDAESVAERVVPRLSHSNSAVVLSAIRVILYMTNYILKDESVNSFFRRIGSPLVTLLNNGSEVQFVALRNIQLILQRKPDFLKNDIKVFFCKYNDPIYVKIAKLEIIFRLVSDENIEQVLPELKEYATEIDVDFVRKSIRAIGKCAIKIESSADRCVRTLVDLIKTKVNYVVQESIVVIKDIFRRYPNRYEGIITTLCENLDSLDESEAKASMIWIIGHYSDRIENANELLEHFLESFKDETPNVQLALLTAVVKLFIKRPTKGQELIPKILKWCTEDIDNPDLRDRGFIYWRLLSTDPVAAKVIVFGDSPPISAEMENLPSQTLEELFLHISTLASIYHKTPGTFIGGLRQKKVDPSPAFVFRDFSAYGKHLDGDVFARQAPIANDSMDGMFGDEPQLNLEALAINEDAADDDEAEPEDHPEISSTPIPESLGPNQLDMFLNSITNQTANLNIKSNPFGFNGLNQEQNGSGFSQQPSFGPIFGRGQNVAGISGGLVELDPFGPSKQAATITVQQPLSQQYGTLNNTGLISSSMNPLSLNSALSPTSLLPPNGNSGLLGAISSPALLPPTVSYIPPESLILDMQAGKGLEVTGTFSRRSGRVYFEATLSNKGGLQPLSDFAILFNRNTFGLSPAEPLNVPTLLAGQSTKKAIALKIDIAAGQPSNPVNSLYLNFHKDVQIALKCNLGILYFQALLPVHVLFLENSVVDADTWLRSWSTELPPSSESVTNFAISARYVSVDDVKTKLFSNNVFTVAQRTTDLHNYFTFVKLANGLTILSEIKFDFQFQFCQVSSKSLATHLIPAFEVAIAGILSQ
ncbi:AP-1 complex subunit beta-1 [Physocladia obscura]|uniref:AP-1 complex subunit beta-1 n=1 Tax=Physocladia obscura TaxID=109957 RepID=A0AAD5XHF0_9FUNG|nr:AP-1 complex subunit beta-1 [Physocladia obscura]